MEIQEKINEKAQELSKAHGCVVHPLYFVDEEGNAVIGYFKDPPRFVKMKMLDKSVTNPISAASDIIDGYLIKEESDVRIYDERPENDKYYIGATIEASKKIEAAINQFKKK